MKMRHALMIDDNEIDNYISKAIITKNNIAERVTVKSSAIEALEYLSQHKNNPTELPDFIFLDIHMPKMDGFGFLEEFVKLPIAQNNQCVVLMLTSSSDKNDIRNALQFPVVKKFLNKPLDVRMLDNL